MLQVKLVANMKNTDFEFAPLMELMIIRCADTGDIPNDDPAHKTDP